MRLPVVFFLLFFFVGIHIVHAHNPNYVGSDTAITITDPEVSKAYYGELKGQPAVYQIVSAQEFFLYVSILSPDIEAPNKDFSVQITNTEGKIVAFLNGQSFTWERWIEAFAGDSYWKGPEYRAPVPPGTYTITVSNPTNTGKYVLAPGEIETFTLAGTPSTLKEIYLTKTQFFNKPWYALFEGIIGKSLLGSMVVTTLVILGFLYYVVRRLHSKIST